LRVSFFVFVFLEETGGEPLLVTHLPFLDFGILKHGACQTTEIQLSLKKRIPVA
jgi:hypothetical protein